MNNYYGGYPFYNIPTTPIRTLPNMIPNTFNSAQALNSSQTLARPSLLRSLTNTLGGNMGNSVGALATTKTGFSFTGLLNGASKTLNVINQAIPVFYQIKPIWNNAKTMFRVAKAMSSSEKNNLNTNQITNNNTKYESDNVTTNKNQRNSTITNANDGNPTFFV